LRVNSPVSAIHSYKQYSVNSSSTAGNAGITGSNNRVGGKAYDTTGIKASGRMLAGGRGLSESGRKAQESVSLIQTAEDTLQNVKTVLQNMRNLAVKSLSSENRDEGFTALELDYSEYIFELSRLSMLKFNGIELISTESPVTINAQIGDNFDLAAITIDALSIDKLGSIDSVENAREAISAVDNAISGISDAQAKLFNTRTSIGSENRNSEISSEKRQGSERRVRDADDAKIMTERMRSNIQFQPSVSMNAQANIVPMGILQLLA